VTRVLAGRDRREQVPAARHATDTDLFLEAATVARNPVVMTDTEVAAFLSEARTLNVATMGPDGGIHLVAMWFVMHGTSPVFWTYAKSQKARNLSGDPLLSGLAEDGESHQTLRGVQLIGTAEVVSDPAEVLRIGQELSAKYARLSPVGHLPRQAAKRVGVLLRPARTISWDHRKLATSG
jgi:PPOX class probable F420-dependent enzyme